ncbi:hypothetical protein [Coxiella-like endosymbiont]|uniref:hypothetical protein n=1 Tax=Coxiella-like endosymbiont TaxID=1592897 RepID=UPI00272B7978|nr:hypothetical protein [Coxiella-like endosymbiont]
MANASRLSLALAVIDSKFYTKIIPYERRGSFIQQAQENQWPLKLQRQLTNYQKPYIPWKQDTVKLYYNYKISNYYSRLYQIRLYQIISDKICELERSLDTNKNFFILRCWLWEPLAIFLN